MAMFDDGAGFGPRLHVAGTFAHADGVRVNGVARWDGDHWSPLGGGLPGGNVEDMLVFDPDGAGPAGLELIFVGEIEVAGEVRVHGIVRWDGSVWKDMPEDPMPRNVYGAILGAAVFDWGEGPRLVANTYDSRDTPYIVGRLFEWDGARWSQFGHESFEAIVTYDMKVVDVDGAGPLPSQLAMVGGVSVPGQPAEAAGVALWDGENWSHLPRPFHGVLLRSIEMFGGMLHVAGTNHFGDPVENIARWNGESWETLGSGLSGSISPPSDPDVNDLVVFEGSLYACGSFTHAGGVSSPGVARWDGNAWHPVSTAPPTYPTTYSFLAVTAMVVAADGAGTRLVAGGGFDRFSGVRANHIAAWDGQSWAPIGAPRGKGTDGSVHAILEHDDGSGLSLFVGGRFGVAGATPANNIARWDGARWRSLGAGVLGSLATNSVAPVLALAEFDEDGPGPGRPALFVGGEFNTAGGQPIGRLARWSNGQWSSVAIPGPGSDARVATLAVFDEDADGPGAPALFAGGRFRISGFPAIGSAKFLGGIWTPFPSGAPSLIARLRVLDDGSGPALYATHGSEPESYKLVNGVWSSFGQPIDDGFFADIGVMDVPGVGRTLVAAATRMYIPGSAALANLRLFQNGAWVSAPGTAGLPIDFASMAIVRKPGGDVAYLVGRSTGPGARLATAGMWDGDSYSSLGLNDPTSAGVSRAHVVYSPHRKSSEAYVGGDFLGLAGRSAGRIARWMGCDDPCPGDTNGDGVVDALDLYFVLGHWGRQTPSAFGAGSADLNGDNRVNFPDLNIVLGAFGMFC